MMNRRTFLCGLTLGALAAEPQQAARRVPRIGYLAEARLPAEEAFLRGLRELGYIDGQNIAIEYRYRRAGSKELGDLAVELVGLKVDLIVAVATPATRAAKQATSSIPIVLVDVGDPVAFGFVASLAHPGGNITGMSAGLTEFGAKGLELLKQAFPTASQIAVLTGAATGAAGGGAFRTSLLAAASTLKVKLGFHIVEEVSKIDEAFASMRRARPEALLVLPDHLLFPLRERIVELVAEARLPAMYLLREYATSGGLMAFTRDSNETFRRAASFVDKILNSPWWKWRTSPSEHDR